MTRTSNTRRSYWIATMALLSVVGLTHQARAESDEIQVKIPFAFEVGQQTLPAGDYKLTLDWSSNAVTIDGGNHEHAFTVIETRLAPHQHSDENDARVVFDRVGTTYILSEVWEPGVDGALVHLTKGTHEHNVIHIRRTT